MTTVSTNKGAGVDPKQLLNEEIDEAFAEAEVMSTDPRSPIVGIVQRRIPLRRLLMVAAVAASVSLVATTASRILARRKRTLGRALVRRTAVHRARGARRVGYERYRFGRFGRAFLAYTYKVPEAHIHVPQLAHTIPSVRVKLPTVSR